MQITEMTLWDVPDSEWEYYRELVGPECVGFSEYKKRLQGAALAARENGIEVRFFRGTVEEVRKAMAEIEVSNTPDGRAAGIAVAQSKRMIP